MPRKKSTVDRQSCGRWSPKRIVPFCAFVLIYHLAYKGSRSYLADGTDLMAQVDAGIHASPLQRQTNDRPHDGDGIVRLSSGQVVYTHRQPVVNDWKLWHLMTPDEQAGAMARLAPITTRYGKMYGDKQGKTKHGTCDSIEFRNGHSLCGPAPAKPCNFFSFGINDDPSFDQSLADTWGCRGFAADPTVQHPSKIHPLVTFHNIGLKTLAANEERMINKGDEAEWWEMSIPGIFKSLGLQHLEVLKIDCEGCEVAFARDILLEDRHFLSKVDQVSLETHTSRSWINSTEAVYYFALQFALLEEAGFQLEWTHVCGCSKRHETSGCMPEMATIGFPCGYDPWPGHPKVVLGRSCQDSLWKRYPINNSSAGTVG